jgi:hypothetical protein
METAQATPTPVAPAPTQAPVAPAPVETKPEVNLVTRASAVKFETPKEVTPPEFDVNEINKIADPAAKEYAEKAYKSFQRGFNSKFQELAELRKNYEAKINENSQWTPQKVQSMLQDPNFVQAAKQVVATQNPPNSGLTEEQYSALSDGEKARINQMESELSQLKQQNFQAVKVQEDTALKSKYANYSSDIVDVTINDLVQGKVRASREDIFKVLDYDDGIKRAYELGRQDERGTKQEKLNAASYESPSTVPVRETPQKTDKETDRAFLSRLFFANQEKYGKR